MWFVPKNGTAVLKAYPGKCNLCSSELPVVLGVCSERQPTLDRLDCALPHTSGNVDVKCLKCNRAINRGSLGRGCTTVRKIRARWTRRWSRHDNSTRSPEHEGGSMVITPSKMATRDRYILQIIVVSPCGRRQQRYAQLRSAHGWGG